MKNRERLFKEAKLFGFILGDGWISKVKYERNGKEYSYLQVGFSGDPESLEKVREELIELYEDIGKATIQTRETSSPKQGIHGTTSQMIANTKVAERFIELGMPIGKRVEQDFVLPDWIVKGSDMTKRGFISGFYSAEGYTPKMQANDKTIRPLGFNFHKRKTHATNLYTIVSQFSSILSSIGINFAINISERETPYENLRAEFLFSNSAENLAIQSSVLVLDYSKDKDDKLFHASIYYMMKKQEVDRLKEVYFRAINEEKESATLIAKETGVERGTIYQWRKRANNGDFKVGLPNSFPTFTKFKERYL